MSASAVAAPERFSEDANYSIPAVEIFESGTHDGQTYTDQDLDQICANFERLSSGDKPRFAVCCTLGHEPTDPNEPWPGQQMLEGSGLPAAAWVSRVWREGPTLMAQFSDMDPDMARAIKGRRYASCSAEIYPNPQAAGLDGTGMVLRRVAILGADVRKVKNLQDLPSPVQNSETPHQRSRVRRVLTGKGDAYVIFSEIRRNDEGTMNRDDMLQKLTALGYDASVFGPETPDTVLAEIIRVQSAGSSSTPNTDDDPSAASMNDEDPCPTKPTDKDSAKKYLEYAMKMADLFGGGDDKVISQDTAGIVKASENDDPDKKKQFAEQDRRFKANEVRLQEIERRTEQRLQAERKAACFSEVTALVKTGQVLPAEVDGGIVELLMLLPHDTVHTFAEKDGRQVKATAFDRALSILKARPKLHTFAEKVKGGGAGGKGTADEEKAQVEEHWNSFSERFTRMGTSKQAFIAAFEKRRTQTPDLTAEQYLGEGRKRQPA